MTERSVTPSAIEFAILAYCSFQAADLPTSWLTAPVVKWGWLAFIIWCLPAIFSVYSCWQYHLTRKPVPILLAGAVCASLLGTLGSLNVLQHLGLAIAISSFVPLSLPSLLWLGCAIGWLPALGWVAKLLPLPAIIALQFSLAIGGSAIAILYLQPRRQKDEG